MRYDAAIFDLFGTLVDFLPDEDYESAALQVASVLDIPTGDFRRVWSDTRVARDLGRFGSVECDLRNALLILGVPIVSDRVREAARIRLDLYTRNLEPRAGAVDTLTRMRALGLKVGLITVCGPEIHQLWSGSALSPLMDTAVFSCIEGLTKPDPELYLRTCRRLQVQPERCLYVGDGSYTELAGASTVGMHAVMIRRGYRGSPDSSSSDIEEWTGDYVSELPELLALVE